jgi:autotransporter-associated beta strand protein
MVAAALLAVGAPKPAKAANLFWDANGNIAGTGGAGTWASTGQPNWVNAGSATSVSGTDATTDFAFSANDIAYFTGTGATVTLADPVTIGGLNFAGFTDYQIAGTAAMNLAAPLNSGAASVPGIAVGFGGRAVINVPLTGNQGLVKTGNGTLVLAGTNSISGSLTIRGGSLVITDPAQLGQTDLVSIFGFASNGSPGYSGGRLVVAGAVAGAGMTVAQEISVGSRGSGAANGSAGLASIGNNTFSGGISVGVATGESRLISASGNATVTGDLFLNAGNSAVFFGSGNWILDGKVSGTDLSGDRLIKTNILPYTTLWLKNDQNSFSQTLRIDAGSVRVGSGGALGVNNTTQAVDLNNGELEIRTDAPGTFDGKFYHFRNNVSGRIILDSAPGSSLYNQTINLTNVSKGTGDNVTNFNFSGRNGYSARVTGIGGVIGTLAGTAANFGEFNVNNGLNGLLTLDGAIWHTNQGTTARTLWLQGNGDTLLTGNILAAGAAHRVVASGTGRVTLGPGVNASTYTGAMIVNQGVLAFHHVGAFAASSGLELGNLTTVSGTLTYLGGTATLAKNILLRTTTADAFINASGTGALTLTGALQVTVNGAKSLVLGGTSTADNTLASVFANSTGTHSLRKQGSGTWVISPTADNTFTGATTVANGVLKLREVGGNFNILPDAAAVIFNVDAFTQAAGGVLRYEGATNSAGTELVGALTPTAGHASIQSVSAGTGSAALTFASMGARGAGATLDISLTGGTVAFTAAPTGTNGIVGGWATFGGTDWLAVGSPASALSSYTTLAASGLSATANYLSAADLALAGPEAVNSLKLAGAQTLTLNGLLTNTTGGVLFDNSTGAATITGGTLGASASEVIVTTAGANSANALTIASLISGGAGSLTKSGPGLLVISGANTYTGATNINQGTVQLVGTTAALGANSNVNLRQGATLDLNSSGGSASNWNTALAAPRVLIGALAGTGTVLNTNAAAAILNLGNGNGNGTFNGVIDQNAGVISVVKNGTGTQSFTGLHDYTGATVLRNGTLAFTSLANIGQASGIGRGDATDADSNAASLIFDGGTLLYTGNSTTDFTGGRQVNIYQETGTPTAVTDRLFTLAGNATIDIGGTWGNNVLGRNDNNAAIVFANTGPVRFLGTGARVMVLRGNSSGDSRIDLQLTDNPNSAVGAGQLSIERSGWTSYWVLGNPNNSYTGRTLISGGALTAQDGASLPTASNLQFADWGGVFQSSGTFSRGLGAGSGQFQAVSTAGLLGFAAHAAPLVVDWSALATPVWGNVGGTVGFLRGGHLTLGSQTTLADVEIRGNFEIRTNTGANITFNSGTNNALTVTSGTAGLSIGQLITGPNIPAGTYITNINSGTDINISANATLTATGQAGTVTGSGWRQIQVDDNSLTGLDFATVSGVISGDGSLSKFGGATLILGDANTYTGNTFLRQESLIVSSIGADGATSSSLGTNVGGGFLYLGNPTTTTTVNLTYVGRGEVVTRPIYIGGTTGTRRIESSGSGPIVLTQLLNNDPAVTGFTGTGDRTLELRGVNTDLNMVTSALANQQGGGTTTVTKADGGVWVLAPASGANTFTGVLNVNSGTLGLTASGVGAAASIAINNASIFAFGGDLSLTKNVTLANNATAAFEGEHNITITGSVTKAAGNNDQTVANNLVAGKLLTINGNFVNAETTNSRTINIRGFGSTVWNGVIANSTGAATTTWDIGIAPNASFTLAGGSPNTLTGGLRLTNGNLILDKAGALGPTNGVFIFNGGRVSATTNNYVINTPVRLDGESARIVGENTLRITSALTNNNSNRYLYNDINGSGTLNLEGAVNLSHDGSSRILVLLGSGVTNISGALVNGSTATASSLYYRGTGTVNLTAANTFGGSLRVERGEVRLSGAGTLANISATGGEGLFIRGSGVFVVDNSGTNNNDRLRNTGALNFDTGVFRYIGNNAGSTETAGILRLSNGAARILMEGAGNNVLTFSEAQFQNSQATLDLTGITGLGVGNQLRFTTAPTLVGGILPRVQVGADFATYNASTGIVALAAYDAATAINAAVATGNVKVGAGYGTDDFDTSARTLNALAITDVAARNVGGLAKTVLTLTSGGILAAGGTAGSPVTHVLSVPRLNLGAGYIQVAADTTLDFTGSIVTGTTLNKSGPGTLLLSARQFNNSTTSIAGGTVRLSGLDNVFYPDAGNFSLDLGGTLDLNGTAQFVRNLQSGGELAGSGGLVTNTSASAAAFVVRVQGANSAFFGRLSGNIDFGRISGWTFTLGDALDHTGLTVLMGNTVSLRDRATLLQTSGIHLNYGALAIDNSGAERIQINDRIGDNVPLFMSGGTFSYTGLTREYASERMGVLNLVEGFNTINANVGSGDYAGLDLTFAGLNRTGGAVINFAGSNLGQDVNNARIRFQQAPALSQRGFLGAWAIANSTDYATYNPVLGVGVMGQGGFAGYDSDFGTGKFTQINGTVATTTVLSSAETLAAVLKFNGNVANRIVFSSAANVLNLELGGLLRSNNQYATAIGTPAVRGVLTAGGASAAPTELVLFSQAAGTPNFGTGAVYTAGSPVVTGINTLGMQVGQTVISGGNFAPGTTVVSIDSNGRATLSSNAGANASGQTLAAGSFDVGVTVLNSAVVTMASTVGLVPGMSFNGTGIQAGTYVVSVDSPTQVTLNRPATAAGANLTFTAGMSDFALNAVLADNAAGGSLRFIKSGAGVVNLTAVNTHTGGTVVQQGTLNVFGDDVGTVIVPAGGLVINGGNATTNALVRVFGTGALHASTDVSLFGSARLVFTAGTSNTLSSLTFVNSGGEIGNADGLNRVSLGANGFLQLTAATPISASSANAAIVSGLFDGNVALRPNAASTVFVDGFRLLAGSNSRVYTDLTPTLNVTSNLVGDRVDLIKTGVGLLQLSGQNTFRSFDVQGGAIVLGANSAVLAGGRGVASGPLGTGVVTFAPGVRLLVDNTSRTVANQIVYQGIPTFSNTGTAASTLTLTGSIDLPNAAVVNVESPYLTVALLGAIPNIGNITSFTVNGLGRLIFNASGYTGDFDATALGNPTLISLLHDGDGSARLGTSANGFIGELITLPGRVRFDAGIVPNVTVGRAGGTLPLSQALNKQILIGGGVDNLQLGLTLTNNQNFGLRSDQDVTLLNSPSFSVSTYSQPNTVSGLDLRGKLSGTGLTKTGNGVMVLGNAANDFVGDVVVQRGGLAISDSAALGDAANNVVLTPNAGGNARFRVLEDMTFGRSLVFGNTSDTRTLEVVAGKTLTMGTAFGLGAANVNAAASLTKEGAGTLLFGVPNTGWTGQFNINAGVVRVSAPDQLTSGILNVGGMTAALELTGDNTFTNAVRLTNTGDWANITGIGSLGALRSVSGTNVFSGTTSLINPTPGADNVSRTFGFGADTGATLTLGRVEFSHASGGSNRNSFVYLLGQGTINLTGVFDNTAGTIGNHFVYQVDDNVVNVTAANAFAESQYRVYRGTTVVSGAGTLGNAASRPLVIFQDGKVVLDNTLTNTANRLGTANRVLDMRGGVLEVIPNAAGTTNVTTAAFNLLAGGGTVILGAGGNNTLTFGSLGTNGAGTLNLTGTFGTATNRLTFTTAPGQSNGLITRVTVNGDSFATYNATNGVIAFTGFSAAQNILSAATTATYQATFNKANSLTGAQTISALALTSAAGETLSVGGLGGLNPATLTISSGAILANGTGTGSTLAVPIVAFGGAEAIFHVASGQALTVTSSMTGTNGMTKALPGSLLLQSPQFLLGNTTVNSGTLRLAAGATNTLWYGIGGLGVNNGATLDLNGGVQYAGNLYANDVGSQSNTRGGSIINSAVGQATLVVNGQSSFNGVISGDIAFGKVGTSTTTINFPQTYTGPTFASGIINVYDTGSFLNTSAFTVSRGRLSSVNDTGSLYNVADRFSDTAPIAMYAGGLLLNGRPTTDVSERFGAVTLHEGLSTFEVTSGGWNVASTIITVADLVRASGSTASLRFNNLAGFGQLNNAGFRVAAWDAGTPPLVNGIIGPWAVVDRDWATYGANGVAGLGAAGANAYDGGSLLSGPSATDNIRMQLGASATILLTEDVTVGTLNLQNGANPSTNTIDLNGRKLTLAGGGLMISPNNGNSLVVLSNGTITAGTTGVDSDLYVFHSPFGTDNRRARVDAAITDNGAGKVRLVLTGGDNTTTGTGQLILNGANTYTGGTVMSAGYKELGTAGVLGTGGFTVERGLFVQLLGGVIPEQALALGGGATLTLANQANSFTSITVRNSGGGAPTLNLTGTTSLKGGLTVTSWDPSVVPVFANGVLDLSAQNAAAFDIGAHEQFGRSVIPLRPSLDIVSVITNGGIVKSGSGVLQLSAASTFAGGVTVNAGGLAIGANSNPLAGAVASGPVGTGLLTMAGGTSLLSTGSWTIGNAVTFLGDTTFASPTANASSLTINGVATLPSVWNVNVLNPLLTVSLADASPSVASDVINKSGLGILSVGNYAGTILVSGGLSITADGNGRGTREVLAIGGDIDILGDTAITVNRSGSGPFARNKVVQKDDLTITGNIMSVTNLSGYGLEFTGTTTLSGPAHFSVGTASNWLQNSGLILSGVIDDGVNDYGLIKSGPGTLELRGVNTFGAVGRTIDILGGVLAVNSDAALGAAGNTVNILADGLTGVGFRATSSFTTGRTFVLGQPNVGFEVVRGEVLTLTAPFNRLAGNGVALGKNYAGVLALTADNTGWTGPITVSGGALRLGHANAAGSGTITANSPNWRGAGVELFNDVTVSNPLTLIAGSTDNIFFGGTSFSGQLSSFSGDNTYAGPITFAFDASIGARAGSTLRITGGITNTTTSRALGINVDATGTVIIDGVAFAATGMTTNELYSIQKRGAGTLSIRNVNTVATRSDQPGLHLKGGLTILEQAGTWAARVYIDKDSSLWLDDRSITVSGAGHTTANGRLATNNTLAREVGFRGGELLIRGSLTVNDSLTENIGKPTFARGASTITLEKNAAGRMNLVFWAAPDNIAPAQNTTAANTDTRGASVLFRGDVFGVSNDPGNANVVFAAGATFNGQTGGAGAANKGIFPWALVGRTDVVGEEFGASFATVTQPAGGGNAGSTDRIVRALQPSEYSTTVSANNNVLLVGVNNRSVTGNVTPNSLTFGGASNLVLSEGVRLNLSSGGILVRTGGTTVISGGVLNQTNDFSPLNIWTVGTALLTIDSAINGGNGTGNARMSMIKAGAGTLVLNPPTTAIAGLTTIGTNSLSGQFVLNEGTVRLGAGLTNAIQSNNYAALVGGTLDLNGGSQFFGGVFADQDYVANNTVVMNSGANTAHFLYNNDNAARNWSGSIQGDVKFTRSGQNTTNLYAAHTYTGSTVINGGNVLLRDEGRLVNTPSIEINYGGLYFENNGTIGLADRVNDAATITLRGGIIELRGSQQQNNSELLGVVTLAASNSFINAPQASGVAGSSNQLDITRLNRAVGGGTVNFTGANGLIGTSSRVVIRNLNGVDLTDPDAPNAGLTGGILGGWAIVGTSDFATSIPGLGIAALGADGFPTYSNLTSAANTIALAAPTDNININAVVAGAVVVAADTTLNSLRMGNVGTDGLTANTVDIAAGRILTLTSGGLLFFSSAGHSVGAINGQGTLTSGGPELFIYTQGGSDKRVRANVADGGQSVALTKSGNAVLRLSGTNSYTGGTFVNQGTLHIEGTSNIPAATDPLKGLVISGATVNLFTAGRNAASNYATIAGAGVLNYIGDNTQYGLILDNVGSAGNPTIRTFNTLNRDGTGSKGVLTIGAGGITATSANVGTVSIIEGRLSFGAAGGTIDVGAIDVNGVSDVDPLRATLQLQAIVATSGAINKTGTGVLQLNAQSLFTGDFNVLAGGLRNGVGNAGSRFADLTIAAGARYDLGGQSITWGSLSGAGDIFSASGTPTLNVGFNDADSIFSGRLMRFNDAAYAQLTKFGTGTLTMDSAQNADGSWSTIRVEGGRLVYGGAGQAFPGTVASAASVFSVEDGSVLELSNLTTAVNHRLGLNIAGTFEQRGGTLLIGGSATAAVSERIANVNAQFGSGRIELRPNAAQPLLLEIGVIGGGNNHSTLVLAGLSGATAGNGVANVRIGTINYLTGSGAQSNGTNGQTNIPVRGDILADASASGLGSGFLMRDVVAVGGLTTLNHGATDYVLTLPSAAGITIGANVTGLGFTGAWTVGAINGNDVTLTGGTTIAPSGLNPVTVNFSNFWRALAANELNLTPRGLAGDGVGGWAQGQNAGVSSAQTLSVDTIVNSLTFSGTASLNSGLGAAFGSFGPGGRPLTLQLAGATAFLVKDGSTSIGLGSLSSAGGTTIFGHVLAGASATFTAGSGLGLNSTGGLVKAGDGVLNLEAQTYFNPSILTVTQGRVNLSSTVANTLPIAGTQGAIAASTLRVEGLNAIVDLNGRSQAINELRSSNEKPGQAGTVTNSGATATLTTIGNSAFAGALTGNLNLVRDGNTTTVLTSASSYTGLTTIRGGNLQLRDAGALTGTSAISVQNGALILDNYGLNAVENPTRLNPATPITLSGGEFRIDGAGASDITVRANSVTAGSGRNTLTVRPYVNMGGTVRLDVGNLALVPNARQTVMINGWSNANSGGFNTLGNQSLTGSGLVFIENVNGAAGPANFNLTGVGTNGTRFVNVASAAGLTAGLAVSGTNIPAGATISSIVSPTQIQISVAATGTSSTGTLRATNLTNELIGGWAVANGSTFATYDSLYGVMEMGFSSGGFAGPAFTGGDFSAATVATGNYNDASSRTISGAKVANSWRMGPTAAQNLTFSAGATLTLGVGIITNGNQLVSLLASDAANSITTPGGDLYVFLNQNATEIEPRLTGAMALVSSGGATLRLKPKFASNDYTGGTFVNAGTLTLDGTGSPARLSLTAGVTTAASTTVTVANTTGLLPGMVVTGANIPAGTTIASVTNGTTLELSAPATAAATGLTFGAFGFAGGTTVGSTTLTVASTTGLLAGMQITGNGIPAGARIASITNGTTLVLSAPATATAAGQIYSAGLVALPGDVTVQNATLNMSGNVAKAGQVSATSNVTIKGHGRFLLPDYSDMLAGVNVVNRLGSVTFITDGAQGSNPDFGLGNPNDVAAFSVLALSGTNAITSTSQVMGRVPSVYTGDAARTRLVFDSLSPVITVNAGDALAGLNMNVPITQGANANVASGGFIDMTSLTKMGLGTVVMISADSDFTAPFVLAQGSLMLGNNSVAGGGGASRGPVGAGTLVIEGGTTILSDNTARTLHNPVTVNGDFTFGGVVNGANVTLAGAVDLGAAPRTINVPSMAVTATFNGSLTTTAGTGNVGLTKTGAGTLKLGSASSLVFGGAGFTIAQGLVVAGAVDQIPASTPLTIAAGAGFDLFGLNHTLDSLAGAGFVTNSQQVSTTTLTLNPAQPGDTIAFAGVFADNKALSPTSISELLLKKTGLGTLELTNTSLNVGATSIDSGTVRIAGAGAFGRGNITVANGATLEYARTDTFTVPNVLNGDGVLRINGAGAVARFTGNSTTTLTSIEVDAGTLQFGDGGTTGAIFGATALSLAAGTSLRFDRTDSLLEISTAIDGDATTSIVQAGSGKTTLTMPSNTNFLGEARVEAGELDAAAADALSAARQIVIASGATFTASSDGATGYGMGSMAIDGPDVFLNGGVLRLLGAGGVATDNVFGALNLAGGTISSGSADGVNSLTVTGHIDVTQDTAISARNVALAYQGVDTTPTDITVAATKTLTFSGTLADDQVNGVATSFDKKGAGTLVLSGDNSGMTGVNTVSAGVVDIRHVNALGTGDITVNSTAFIVSNQAAFGTAGNVAGNVIVSNGGSIGVAAPGVAAIGNLAVSNLRLEGGSTVVFKVWDHTQVAGTGYDRLDLGTLDLTGATSTDRITIKLVSMSAANAFGNSTLMKPVTEQDFVPFNFGTYDPASPLGANVSDLFRFDASEFTYTDGTASDAGLWSLNFDNGAIMLTAVPEPSTYGFGLGALALAAAAIRRRRQTKKA